MNKPLSNLELVILKQVVYDRLSSLKEPHQNQGALRWAEYMVEVNGLRKLLKHLFEMQGVEEREEELCQK